ncbi:hypothetical protein T484DRAFT_1872816 [Baffinella frigidus]|nr:hypothetical protein T484DRAFT_1872816 [Cryptophyta sp. CCMP2293]
MAAVVVSVLSLGTAPIVIVLSGVDINIVSVLSLGTAPIVIVLSGVDIKIVQLPPGQLRPESTGKRKTKRKVR